MVLLLYHSKCMVTRTAIPRVWMDVGLSSNNSRRYINISEIMSHMDDAVIQALPGLHAFTGCDYTSSFLNKGKIKPMELMLKNDMYIEAMAKLGECPDVTLDIVKDIERYVCALYGMPKLSSVDDARFASFQQKYAPKKGTRPLEKIKGINPSSMPPCGTVLLNKIRRTNYVAHMWKRARLPVACILKAEDHGWKLKESSHSMNWYNGEQLPQNVADIIAEDESDSDEDTQMQIDSSDDSDDDE